jgi:hypothetical protein
MQRQLNTWQLKGTFYRHYNRLSDKLDGLFSRTKKGHDDRGECVRARKLWLIRRLAEKHAPELLRESSASGTSAAVHQSRGATQAAARGQALQTAYAYLVEVKRMLKKLAPRGGGRLTNAQSTLRRYVHQVFRAVRPFLTISLPSSAVLAALCCALEEGQYSEAGRDLGIRHHDIKRHKELFVERFARGVLRNPLALSPNIFLSSPTACSSTPFSFSLSLDPLGVDRCAWTPTVERCARSYARCCNRKCARILPQCVLCNAWHP